MLGLVQGREAGEVARALKALANRLAPEDQPAEAWENIIEPQDRDESSSSYLDTAKTLIRRIDKDFRAENSDTEQFHHAII